MKKSNKTIQKAIAIFWVLIVSVIVFVSGTYFWEWLRGTSFLPAIAALFLLGIALIFFTLKEKIKGKLKLFFLLTGSSIVGFFVFVILHNLFYALGIITSHITVLKYLMEILHVTFFIIAVLICPIGFLVGAIGSIVLLIKKRKGGN